MPRRLAPAIVLVAAIGCGSAQNTECRWPDEPARQLDLRSDADADHLIVDVELAEELSVRFADNSGTGPGPLRQRLRLEKCFEPLMSGIAFRHGVPLSEVLAAQARVGERGLNLIVNVPVTVFFGAVTLIVLRTVRRRFSANDEPAAVAIASLIAAVAVAGLTTGFGRLWQMLSEAIRVGNGHLGGQRGLRLPWVQHSFEYFIVALAAFLLIAVLYHARMIDACRSRAKRNAANLPSCW
jgi:hypothetical protein